MSMIGDILGGFLGAVQKDIQEKKRRQQEKIEEKCKMKTLKEAIGNISAVEGAIVVKSLGWTDKATYCFTSTASLTLHDDHGHKVYYEELNVPSMDTARNLVADLVAIASATENELNDRWAKTVELIRSVGERVADANGLARSVRKLQDVLEASIAAEQSSHRRFEQLVQTLSSEQSDVKALYDSIDTAIKKATDSASSGTLKQIDERRVQAVAAVKRAFDESKTALEVECRKRIESAFEESFAGLRAHFCQETQASAAQAEGALKRSIAELERKLQTDTGATLEKNFKEREQAFSKSIKKTAETIQDNATRELAVQRDRVVQQIVKDAMQKFFAETGRELARTKQSVQSELEHNARDAEERLQQELEKTKGGLQYLSDRAAQRLRVDLVNEVPAMFRTYDSEITPHKSTFAARLKWLFTGRA